LETRHEVCTKAETEFTQQPVASTGSIKHSGITCGKGGGGKKELAEEEEEELFERETRLTQQRALQRPKLRISADPSRLSIPLNSRV
jgi:hypothetical protein